MRYYVFFYKYDEELKFKPDSIEAAYLQILGNNLATAKSIFQKNDSPRAKWGVSFAEILSGYIQDYPTYFGIRNFLEIDLEFLIKNNKINYVEQFLGASELLSGINTETYKYLARVMMTNSIYEAAEKYLMLAKSVLYNDPELHYMLTCYYLHYKDYKRADKHITECLRILPEYYPAIVLSKKIQSVLNLIDESDTI